MSRRMVYQIPRMDATQVRKGIAYKTVEDGDLKLDIYLPPDLSAGERRPAVLFIHGEPWTTEAARFDALATGQYTSWGGWSRRPDGSAFPSSTATRAPVPRCRRSPPAQGERRHVSGRS